MLLALQYALSGAVIMNACVREWNTVDSKRSRLTILEPYSSPTQALLTNLDIVTGSVVERAVIISV